MKDLVARHPFVSFVLIAFGWTWPLAMRIDLSLIFPLLALFGPCIAALVVIYIGEGRVGLEKLGRRFSLFRSPLRWYIVAALLPLILLVALWGIYVLLWENIPFEVNSPAFLSLVVAILIVGEEVGWRGYLLPHLLQSFGSLTSSLIVGLVWALWHLPNFWVTSFPHYGLPFLAFLIMILAYSILFTWLHIRSSGSILIAVIFHAALNIFSVTGMEPSREYWVKALVYSSVALAVAWRIRNFSFHSDSSSQD